MAEERPPRPEPLHVIFDQIPGELQALDQWVMWRYVWKEGKPDKPGKWDKPPLMASGYSAKSTDPLTWTTFKTATSAYLRGLELHVDNRQHFDGIGFVPRFDDEAELQIVFGDLDKCRDKDTGAISTNALQDLESINSYCEPSPSGTGLRFVAYGAPPFPSGKAGRKKGHIELYQGGHYLTITGQRLPDFPASIEKRTDELNAFYEKHFGKHKPEQPKEEAQRNSSKLTDEQVIVLAAQAHNSPKFLSLMGGAMEGYPSQSEADLALCQLIAFYTPDPAQIDRIFRRSKLYREKWERYDYREDTIRIAVEHTTEHYSGNGPKDFEAATEKQKPEGPTGNDQDDSESDAAADEAEVKAASPEEISVLDVSDVKFGKDGKPQGMELCISKAARSIVKKMRIAMSEDSTEIYRFDGEIYRADGEREIDIKMCSLMGDEITLMKLKEILRRVRNTLLSNPVKFEPDPYLLPVKNGVCDLRTGEFREYRAEDLLLDKLDIVYDKDARCPEFMGYMISITPVIVDRLTLIDWMAAHAIKIPLAYVLFLLGLGRNGKGIYEKLLKAFYGQRAFRDFKLAEVAKNNFAAGEFYRKRGWIASESGKDKKGAGATIGTDFMKLTSGNGVIDGDRKNKTRIQFEPFFQTTVDSNSMPAVKDNSVGWEERFVKINLPYLFLAELEKDNPLKKLRDPDLYEKLTTQTELSGILNLILYRAKEICKTKSIIKRSGKEMFREYADQSGSVTAFLDTFCEYVEDLSGLWTPSAPIYDAYENWCHYTVGDIVDKGYFGKQLKKYCGNYQPKRGKDKDRNNTTEYRGLIFDNEKYKATIEGLQSEYSIKSVSSCL